MALRLVLLTLCCLLGAASAGRTVKQVVVGGPTPTPIGGATPNGADNDVVRNAAAFVVTAINADTSLIPERSGDVSLVSITTASTQVVAGINIRLTVVLEDDSNQYIVQAEVFQDLSQPPVMTLQQPFSYVRREKSVRAPVAIPAVAALPTVETATPSPSHGPCSGTSTKRAAKSKPAKAPKAMKPRKLKHRGAP